MLLECIVNVVGNNAEVPDTRLKEPDLIIDDFICSPLSMHEPLGLLVFHLLFSCLCCAMLSVLQNEPNG